LEMERLPFEKADFAGTSAQYVGYPT